MQPLNDIGHIAYWVFISLVGGTLGAILYSLVVGAITFIVYFIDEEILNR